MKFEDWDDDDVQAVAYIYRIQKTHDGDSSNFKVQNFHQAANFVFQFDFDI